MLFLNSPCFHIVFRGQKEIPILNEILNIQFSLENMNTIF